MSLLHVHPRSLEPARADPRPASARRVPVASSAAQDPYAGIYQEVLRQNAQWTPKPAGPDELAKCQAQVAKYQAGIEALKHRIAAVKQQSLDHITAEQARREKAEKALSKAQTEKGELKHKLAAAEKATAELKQSLSAVESHKADLNRKLERKLARLAEAREAGRELQDRLDRGQDHSKAVQALQADLAAARAQLQTLKRDGKSELAEARAQCKRLEQEQAAAKQELRDAELVKGKLQASQQRTREGFQRTQESLTRCTDMLSKIDKILEVCSCLHAQTDLGKTLQQSRQQIEAFLATIEPAA